jgi:hypothetical protein
VTPRTLARQVQLVEIGEVGQARIAARIARVPASDEASPLEALVATRYAARAGFAAVEAGEGERDNVPSWVVHPAAAAVVSGSLAALRELRGAVFGEES